MHDDVLGRTIAGKGSIGDLSVADLLAMDAGAWFSADYQGEPVPLFTDAAEYCINSGLQMNVEIKPVPGQELRTAELVAQCCAELPPSSVLLSSFSLEALRVAKRLAPDVPRAWLVESVPRHWQQSLADLDTTRLHAQASRINHSTISELKAQGIQVLCYTVNDPLQAIALFDMGVDAICTDRLDLIGPDFFDKRGND